jgi:hypothetical protein
MRRIRVLAILLPLIVIAVASYVLLSLTHFDYAAGVQGRVTDMQGKPLEGVRITFRTAKPVYKAITPVREATTTTDSLGKFGLGFLSEDGDVPYRVEFQKAGYQTVRLSGSGSGTHHVIMKPNAAV